MSDAKGVKRSFLGFTDRSRPRPAKNYCVLDEPDITTYQNAIVPQAILLGKEDRSLHKAYCYGGAYDKSGAQIDPSVIWRGTGEQVTIPFDIQHRNLQPQNTIDAGIYCGLLFNHYGHFLLETLSRVWFALSCSTPQTLVFQTCQRREAAVFAAFTTEVFRALEMLGHRIVVVNDCLQVRDLTVPTPSFVIRRGFNSEYSKSMRRIGQLIAPSPGELGSKIYLTRSGLGAGRILGEEQVERVFERQGFRIVSPEKLKFSEQVAMAQGIEDVGGVLGSALHSLVFSENPRCTVLLRDKNKRVLQNYFIIDELAGIDATYIDSGAEKDTASGLRTLDYANIRSFFASKGWSDPDEYPASPQ